MLAFFAPATAALILGGCVAARPAADAGVQSAPAASVDLQARAVVQGAAFVLRPLSGVGGATLQALQRGERTAPLRYRVIVIPGSGCAGMGSMADRYFAGLLHAQVLVLHKPGVDPQARTAPDGCSPGFVQQDRLSTWLAHARAALRDDVRQRGREGAPALPQLLVGISEGAELLPALAPDVPQLAGLVVVASSGLDPQEAGALQARRLGAPADWQALAQAQAGRSPDSAVLQGRSLGYWRDLWNWRLAEPLVQSPWPVLQGWGGDDALVPTAAYARFSERASLRKAAYCARRIDGADHGLQHRATGVDGVQKVWAWTEQWARNPAAGLCGPLQP